MKTRTSPRPAIIFLMAMVASTAGKSQAAPDQLAEIIRSVRANEQLYRNEEVTLINQYRLHGFKRTKETQGKVGAYVTQDHILRYVRQNELFRFERKGRLGFLSGEFDSGDRIRSYDGQTTKLLEQNQYANIIKGRFEADCSVRPHMLLFNSCNVHAPLSTYLSGHEAMQANLDAGWEIGYLLTVEYKGIIQFNDLKCHVVWVTTSPGGLANDRWELLLCKDRNDIPVKASSFMLRFSKTQPMAESTVEEWDEPKPGIWFPKKWQTTIYTPELLAKGQKVVQSTDKYTATKISLESNHDRDFFSKVEIPEGALVQEIDQGQVINSYRKSGHTLQDDKIEAK